MIQEIIICTDFAKTQHVGCCAFLICEKGYCLFHMPHPTKIPKEGISMPLSVFIEMTLSAILTVWSPGPNNILLLSTASKYGISGNLRFMA